MLHRWKALFGSGLDSAGYDGFSDTSSHTSMGSTSIGTRASARVGKGKLSPRAVTPSVASTTKKAPAAAADSRPVSVLRPKVTHRVWYIDIITGVVGGWFIGLG